MNCDCPKGPCRHDPFNQREEVTSQWEAPPHYKGKEYEWVATLLDSKASELVSILETAAPSREISMVKTKLDELIMWAAKDIQTKRRTLK